MIVYIIVAVTLILGILPVLFIIKIPKSVLGRIVNGLFAASLALLIYNLGGWLYLSIYLKYIFAVVTSMLLIVFIVKSLTVKINPAKKWVDSLVMIPFILFFIYINVLYFVSNKYDSEAINLTNPFKAGNYIIMQGGSNEINFFHRQSKFAVYSFDIVRLNEYGNRAYGIAPENLNDYAIFGTDLYSPCEGTVIGVINNIDDNKPGNINQSRKAGNFVLIKSDGITLMLAHLQRGSIVVDKDDKVTYGSYIGKIGNSGNSREPHLHIEAHRKTDDATVPVAIKFDGEFLRYNEGF
ncbi:MAG: M23 family metallopeptidase [Ignavibacteria bacterium]|nr:M23 family metallopeptidase [Ignavibacteria bacterium]